MIAEAQHGLLFRVVNWIRLVIAKSLHDPLFSAPPPFNRNLLRQGFFPSGGPHLTTWRCLAEQTATAIVQ